MKKIFLILSVFFTLIASAVPVLAVENGGDDYIWTAKNINDSRVRELKYYNSLVESRKDGSGRTEYIWDEDRTGSKNVLDFYIEDTAYNGKVYVAVGSDVPPGNTISLHGAVFLSTDGINWENLNIADSIMGDASENSYNVLGSPLNGVAWNGEKFVVVGDNVTMYSTDGENWSILSNYIRKYKYNNETNSHEKILDKQWELNDIIWDGRKFISVGTERENFNDPGRGIIIDSVDGEEWNVKYTNADMRKILFNNNLYIASGWREVFTSKDGANWEEIKLPSMPYYVSTYIDGTIWNGKKFVLARDSMLQISSDFKKWTEANIWHMSTQDKLFYFDNIENLQYYNGKICASIIAHDKNLKNSIGIFESTDGLSWTKLYMPVKTYIRSLQVTNGNIYAWGQHGEMYVGIPKPDSGLKKK